MNAVATDKKLEEDEDSALFTTFWVALPFGLQLPLVVYGLSVTMSLPSGSVLATVMLAIGLGALNAITAGAFFVFFRLRKRGAIKKPNGTLPYRLQAQEPLLRGGTGRRWPHRYVKRRGSVGA